MIFSWQEVFVETLKVWACKSRCFHYHIAAIFVRDKRILQIGYNGPTVGDDHCNDFGCAKEVNGIILPSGSKRCRGAHAEMNAIVNAAKNGINLAGCEVYCTQSPCYDCAKHLNNMGIKVLYYLKRYEEEFPQASALFERRGIKLIQIKDIQN
ncbi:MAG TPA: deaminase [Candidatus Paceibacterota bacterium]|nr:deaminase [Candidatus Paceibacterota bacterium]